MHLTDDFSPILISDKRTLILYLEEIWSHTLKKCSYCSFMYCFYYVTFFVQWNKCNNKMSPVWFFPYFVIIFALPFISLLFWSLNNACTFSKKLNIKYDLPAPVFCTRTYIFASLRFWQSAPIEGEKQMAFPCGSEAHVKLLLVSFRAQQTVCLACNFSVCINGGTQREWHIGTQVVKLSGQTTYIHTYMLSDWPLFLTLHVFLWPTSN